MVFLSASFCCHTLQERTICLGSSSQLFWNSPWVAGGWRGRERGGWPWGWAGGRGDGGRDRGWSWLGWRDIRTIRHQSPGGGLMWLRWSQVSLVVVEFPNNTLQVLTTLISTVRDVEVSGPLIGQNVTTQHSHWMTFGLRVPVSVAASQSTRTRSVRFILLVQLSALTPQHSFRAEKLRKILVNQYV